MAYTLCSAMAFGANELAQSFTLDGQLMIAGTTTALTDAAAVIKVDVLDPTKTCVLYEEQQTVNTVSSDGYFSIQVGSITGASKRTGSDPGLTMVQVFQNTSAVAATSASGSTCSGNTYTPSADAVRYFRITVTPSSTNVADVLSPDTTIDAAPMAMVAQSLQGYQATDFLAKAGLPTCSSGTFLSYDGTTLSCAGVSGSNGGTVTSVTAGTGLTGGTITASGTLALATSGATAGTYGSASAVPVVTVDTYGRVTNVTTASISSAPSGTASGDLSGTYPGPTVNGLNGTALSISSLTSGQYLKYNGTNWINSTLSVSDSNITYGSEAANTFFAAPNGSAGTPTFRAMVAADLPTVPYTRGGTGLTATPANGQIPIGNGAGYSLATLTQGSGITITNAAGTVTIAASGGTGTVTSVSGTAPISVATGTSTPVVSISQATTSTNGYLSSIDWNTFNSKMSSSLASGDIFVGNSSGGAVAVPVSGDAILSSAGALTLATVATAGTYPKVVVNAKGLVTSGSSLALTDLPSIANGTVLANVSGSAGTPTATTVSSVLDSIGAVQGDILYRGASGWSVLAPGTSGQYLQTQGASANPQWATVTAGGSGTVTSVALSLPTMFTVANSPVTTSGTLTATLSSETANTFLAAPNGSAGSPTFRTIASADLPTIPVSGGGTGLTAGTSGGIPYYATTSTMASSAALTQYGVVYGGGAGNAPAVTAVGTSGYVLTSNGGVSAPTFQQLSLSSGVTGTLPITQGGTGSTTAAAARTALGTAASGANADITSTADLTSLSSSTSAITIAPTGNLNLTPSTAVVSSAVYESPLGTAAAPAYTNSTNPNTGMYFPTSTSLGFATAGANAVTILANGNVGLGTTSPLSVLEVGTSSVTPFYASGITSAHIYNPGFSAIGNSAFAVAGGYSIGDDTNNMLAAMNYTWVTNELSILNAAAAGYIQFYTDGGPQMTISHTGNVGVGTTVPGTTLDVNGGVRAGSSSTVTTCGLGQANGEGTQRYNYTTHGMEYCNGSGWQALITSAGSTAQPHMQVISSSGTFSTPTGTTTSTVFKFTIIGGGGGGGGGTNGSGSYGGGGGGGGATAVYLGSGVAASTSVTVTIGGGGTAGASGNNAGTSGTSSSVVFNGTTVTAAGGTNGAGSSASVGGAGGAGGGCTNATLCISGGTGGSDDGGVGMGGAGGGTLLSPQGPIHTNSAGAAGPGYGTGGGGGGVNSNSHAGGAGAAGIVVVEWLQ